MWEAIIWQNMQDNFSSAFICTNSVFRSVMLQSEPFQWVDGISDNVFPPYLYLLLALRSLELRASRLLIWLKVWFDLNFDFKWNIGSILFLPVSYELKVKTFQKVFWMSWAMIKLLSTNCESIKKLELSKMKKKICDL